MPNNVINEVVLHGVPLSDAKSLILNKKGEIDFSVLVPLPVNFWPGSVGRRHLQKLGYRVGDDAPLPKLNMRRLSAKQKRLLT